MKKILVTYTTMSGSTAEVAQAIAGQLAGQDTPVELLPLAQVRELGTYRAVVLGAPMIMGWHSDAMTFLTKNRAELQRLPLAIFVTALSLTSTGDSTVGGVPLFIDQRLAKPPKVPGRLSFHERYSLVSNYADPILQAAAPATPLSIAFFGGRLDLHRLEWWAKLFVTQVIRAQPGDRRNWEAIRSWARELRPALVARPTVNQNRSFEHTV